VNDGYDIMTLRQRIRRNSLWLAAGELAALIVIPLFTWLPCDIWLGRVVSCPPPLASLISVAVVVYFGFVLLLWWLFERNGTSGENDSRKDRSP
jgi:hypothetical protein